MKRYLKLISLTHVALYIYREREERLFGGSVLWSVRLSMHASHPPFKSAPWAATTRAAWQQGFRLPPPLWLSGSPYMIHSSTIPHTTTNDKADFSESLFPIAPQTGQIISSPTPTSFNVRLHMDFNSQQQQQQQASNPLLFKNLHACTMQGCVT